MLTYLRDGLFPEGAYKRSATVLVAGNGVTQHAMASPLPSFRALYVSYALYIETDHALTISSDIATTVRTGLPSNKTGHYRRWMLNGQAEGSTNPQHAFP